MTKMITRSLSRRLERLERRCALIRDALVINVLFVDPDGRIVDRLRLGCGDNIPQRPFGTSAPQERMPK